MMNNIQFVANSKENYAWTSKRRLVEYLWKIQVLCQQHPIFNPGKIKNEAVCCTGITHM